MDISELAIIVLLKTVPHQRNFDANRLSFDLLIKFSGKNTVTFKNVTIQEMLLSGTELMLALYAQ